jgi:hypothetical protein
VTTTYTLTGGVYLPTQVSQCQTSSSCANGADEVRTTIAYESTTHQPSGVTSGNGSGTLAATQAFAYDRFGNLITLDGPLSGTADTVRFRYDNARQRIGTVSADPDGGGALEHRAQRITYRSDGQASRVETGTVDSQSDSDWAAFATLEQVDVGFDANHRPVTQALISGSTTYALTQTSYDGLGRPQCVAQRMNPSEFASLPSDACTLDTQGSYGPDRIARTTFDAAGQVT